ncbi:amidohydrolase [Myxococcus sp. K15C18031901]|uniref:amidohydrolase family protein n=1 Tax=Myxococcus dinghuensis TaxID=2906761 RepID=UPI0020A7F7B2|nr:amidohydrolase family protein [Myxococcus dinghuensis]MCP3097296.1 amidohydrolase [Myxococcus dinghuensis]
MRNGIAIIDVDRHVMEPMAMWREYLPAKYHGVAPEVRPLSPPGESVLARLERLGDHALLPTPPVVAVEGKPIWRGMTEVGYIEVGLHSQGHREELLAAESAAGQVGTMDASGVDIAMLLPTYAGYLVYDDDIDAARSRAYASAYNRWLADQCRQRPDRLLGAAIISRHEPEHMVADLEAGLREGLRAAVLRPNPVRGRTLGAPELEHFFAACEAADVPVLLHEGAHTRAETAGASRFETHFAQHACSHPMEAMMALLALLEGGVLERHPKLRVALLEAGCGWLPYWLWRLDELEYAQLSNEVAGRVNRRPSEYFRRQCWIAFEPDEVLLRANVDAIGLDRVVFGSDFPHVDHDTNIVERLFAPGAPLDAPRLRAALWDNPARLLGGGLTVPVTARPALGSAGR